MKKKKINKELFKHNSIPFLFISILSAILLFFFGIWIWSKTNNYDYLSHYQPTTAQTSTNGTVIYNEDNPELPYIYKEVDGAISNDFKVMCVGDLHLGHNRDDFTLEIFKRFLDKETPDLVVLNGDLIFNTTDETQTKKLNKFFEDRGQYWTFTLGNHDPYSWQKSEGMVKAREIAFNLLCGKNKDGTGTTSQHCLARDMLADHNNGVGTHFINIRGSNGQTMQTLFMFDYYGIGYRNDVVINWYLDSIAKIKTEFSLTSSPESMAFTHIPFYEMKHFDSLPSDSTIKYVSGFKSERGSCLGSKNGLIEQFLANNTTKLIFAHNHAINQCYEITQGNKKLQMAYTLGIQYNCYSTRSFYHFAALSNLAYMLDCSQNWYIDGITNLYVKADDPTIMHHVFCQDSGVFDGLEHELYIHTHLFITYKGEWINLFNRILLPILAAGCMVYYGFCIYFLVNRKKGVK